MGRARERGRGCGKADPGAGPRARRGARASRIPARGEPAARRRREPARFPPGPRLTTPVLPTRFDGFDRMPASSSFCRAKAGSLRRGRSGARAPSGTVVR